MDEQAPQPPTAEYSVWTGRASTWPAESRLLCGGRMYAGPTSDVLCRNIALGSYVAVFLLYAGLGGAYFAQTAALLVSVVLTAAIVCLSFSCFLLTAFTDPGAVPWGEEKQQSLDGGCGSDAVGGAGAVRPDERRCARCGIKQAPLVYHCHQCKVCVRELDHHCGVTGTCIGARNKICFVAMNSALTCAIYALIGTTILAAVWHACGDTCHAAVDGFAWAVVALELLFLAGWIPFFFAYQFECCLRWRHRRKSSRRGRFGILRSEVPRVPWCCGLTLPESLLWPSNGDAAGDGGTGLELRAV